MAGTKKGRGLPKRAPTTSHYDVRLVGEDEFAAASADMEQAQVAVRLGVLNSKDDDVQAAVAAKVDAAKARLAACTERLYFREISPVTLDALMTAHPYPYTAAEPAPVGFQWPYVHHLAAASALDVEQSPAEWAEWTADWSVTNWTEFASAVLSAQRRSHVTGDIPKG